MQTAVRRNDPCPCGSGKKYKHCHGLPAPGASVLYLHPAKQGRDFAVRQIRAPKASMGRPYSVIPLGVPALLNLLMAQGISVKGLNYPLEKILDPNFDLRGWLSSEHEARLVLIDLHWYEHSYGAISLAEVVKEALPDAWTVLGGLTASGFSREILESCPAVDFVIRGDAEQPLLALTQQLLALPRTERAVPDLATVPNLSYRRDGQVVENPLSYCAATADLDALNFADLSFLQNNAAYYAHEYVVTHLDASRAAMDAGEPFRGRWICTARGCKHECSYCGGCESAHRMLAGREGIIARSPESVVADLKRLQEAGIHQAALSYDIVEIGEPYWRRLLEAVRESGVRIGLYNEFFQLPPVSFVAEFARSVDMTHSCVALSPLSGSERVRRLNGKIYTDAALFNLLDYLNLHSVPIFVYFSLNLPGENEQTLEETIQLASRIYETYPSTLLKILNTCHTVDPLSPMQQHPDKYGITVSMHSFADFVAYCRETQLAGPGSRTGEWRGFAPVTPEERDLEAMAQRWDAAREGREASWWPVPPSW